jgi:DNA-binding CsgD family transcriptional regulator/tetratricopeptide (TPR) repeat protein
VSPVLLGREAALTAIDTLLAGAQAGQGQTLLVAGESGIGKSRLVHEVEQRAAGLGLAVLRGQCFEADRSLPYAPWMDLLHGTLAGRAATPDGTAALGPAGPQLARLLPELWSAGAPPAELAPEQEKRSLQQAIGQFLAHAAAPSAALVVIEDLHWSDDSSLEALLSVARRVPAEPILLLLTYRADQMHPSLAHFLAGLDRGRLASELALEPLSRAEVDAMMQAIFEQKRPIHTDFLEAVYKLTEGNPFFIEEVLKSLIAAGDIFYAGGTWDRKELSELHIPRSIDDAVQQRVAQLEPAAHRLLALAAVAGRHVDLPLLQHLASLPEDELLRLVKMLIDAQLVIEESADQLAFRHELTRQAISARLMARERQRLHCSIAEAVEQGPLSPPEGRLPALAYHFYEAGEWEKALAYSLRVAEQAVQIYAHSEALHYLEQARECAERLGQTDQVAGIYERIGDVYFISGPMDQAVGAFRRALELATTDPARAVLQSKIGRSYVTVSDSRGLAPLHTALDVLAASQPHEQAVALAALGRYYHLHAEHDRAIEFLERAWKLAEPLDDTLALGDIYSYLAGSYQSLLRFEESMAWALAGIALGERKNYPMAMALGYEYLGENAINLGRWHEALEYAASDREIGERIGSHTRRGWAEWIRSMALYNLGELPAAVEAAQAGYQHAVEAGDRRLMLWTQGTLAIVYTLQGAEESAREAAGQARALDRELDQVMMHGWSCVAQAGVHRLRGEPAQAAALLDECMGRLAGTRNRLAPLFLGPVHAEVACELGHLEEAERLIADFLALAAGAEAVHRQALARRIQGQIWTAQGRWAEASQALDDAVATLEKLDSRLELALALAQRGATCLAQTAAPGAGHPPADGARGQVDLDRARADLERALALSQEIGLGPLEIRVHAALAHLYQAAYDPGAAERELAAARAVIDRLAAGYADPALRAEFVARMAAALPRPPSLPPLQAAKLRFGGLTRREREVAALIAQGKSNRDIAAALVVSERTVTTHVTNILNKLGFTSRSQVAVWAAEKNLEVGG